LYAIGVAIFVGGVFRILGWSYFGELAATGLIMLGVAILVVGLVVLVFASRYTNVSRRRVFVIVATVIAIALYAYKSLPFESVFFFLLPLAPYALCLIVAVLSKSLIPAGVGAVAALLLDPRVHDAVFGRRTAPNAAVEALRTELWNLLIFVPLAIAIAWFILRLRHRANGNAP
jgi:hypothetical protein